MSRPFTAYRLPLTNLNLRLQSTETVTVERLGFRWYYPGGLTSVVEYPIQDLATAELYLSAWNRK